MQSINSFEDFADVFSDLISELVADFALKREIETKNVEQVQKCMELSSKFKDDLAKIKTILSQYAVIVHEKEYGDREEFNDIVKEFENELVEALDDNEKKEYEHQEIKTLHISFKAAIRNFLHSRHGRSRFTNHF